MKIAWLDPKISSEMIEDDIGAYQLSEDEFEDDIFQQPTPKASSALFPSQVIKLEAQFRWALHLFILCV